MTDKNLLTKLNNLKNVEPNAEWLSNNRSLLCQQISNSTGHKLSGWELFWINLKCLTQTSTRPVFALGVFLLVLLASSVFSHQLFSEAKPNDSLYIARVISEKARLNTVLDSGERDRMAVKFATNHAKDISTVLADPNFNTEDNQDRIAKLSENFNKEVEIARTKIERMTNRQAEAQKSNDTNDKATTTGEQIASLATSTAIDSEEVVSIATEVDLIEDNGIEVVEEITTTTASSTTEEIPTKTEAEIEAEATIEIVEEIIKISNPMLSLDEVKDLFEKKDYENVNEKLEEISELIK